MTLKLAAEPGLPPPVTKTNTALAKLSIRGGSGLAAAGTNSVVASAGAAPVTENLEEVDADKPPAPDETLAEAEHILVDYLSVLPKGDLVTIGH